MNINYNICVVLPVLYSIISGTVIYSHLPASIKKHCISALENIAILDNI